MADSIVRKWPGYASKRPGLHATEYEPIVLGLWWSPLSAFEVRAFVTGVAPELLSFQPWIFMREQLADGLLAGSVKNLDTDRHERVRIGLMRNTLCFRFGLTESAPWTEALYVGCKPEGPQGFYAETLTACPLGEELSALDDWLDQLETEGET